MILLKLMAVCMASVTVSCANPVELVKADRSINNQYKDICSMVASECSMSEKQVELIANLSSIGDYKYAGNRVNIYRDMAVYGHIDKNWHTDSLKGLNKDNSLASEQNMLDALYSVSYQIGKLKSDRYRYNRGENNRYFVALTDSYKDALTFYEAVLLYLGESRESVDNLIFTLDEIVSTRRSGEQTLAIESMSGELVVNSRLRDILNRCGIKNESSIRAFANIVSFDKDLNIASNIEDLRDKYILPYEPNYTSKSNMMIAAGSLVGKVRYVWGGGHAGVSRINGINPIWGEFNDLYKEENTKEDTSVDNISTSIIASGNPDIGDYGYGETEFIKGCIKPSRTVCPIHGTTHSGTCKGDAKIHGIQDYIAVREDTLDTEGISSEKYRQLFNGINYGRGIDAHRMEGLDCSGYVSWVYNQITDTYSVDSTAAYFIDQSAFEEVPFGSQLLPGDIFAWDSHIVLIVGKLRDNCGVYVTLESTPDIVRYGVIYYLGSTSSDISQAVQIAKEANELIGGLSPDKEPPHVYCMDTYYNMSRETKKEESNAVENGIESSASIGAENGAVENEELGNGIESIGDIGNIGDLGGIGIIDTGDVGEETYISGEIEMTDTSETTLIPTTDMSIHDAVESEITSEESEIEEEESNFVEKALIGRFRQPFKDSADMDSKTAREIIQDTIDSLPVSYLTGYNTYTGKLFKRGNRNVG